MNNARKMHDITFESHMHLMNTSGSELCKFAKNASDKRHCSNGVTLSTLV
jgi:hypothetical protein